MIYKEAAEEGLCFTYWFEVISSGVISLLIFYYISKLVCALWLVNSAGRTLLRGPLKFKVLFVAKLWHDLSPNFLNIASKSLKLSFTLNCVLKHAYDLKWFQWFVLLSTCFRNFEAVPHEWKSFPNPSDTQQRYNKYLTNLVFLVRTVSYKSLFFPMWFMARALCAWAINKRGKKTWSVTYSTDLELCQYEVYMTEIAPMENSRSNSKPWPFVT